MKEGFSGSRFIGDMQASAGYNGSQRDFAEHISADVRAGCKVDVSLDLLRLRYPNYAAFLEHNNMYSDTRAGSRMIKLYALDSRSKRCIADYIRRISKAPAPDIPLECMVSMCLACRMRDDVHSDSSERLIENAVEYCCGERLGGKGMKRLMATAAARGLIAFKDIAADRREVGIALREGRSLGFYYELFELITKQVRLPSNSRSTVETDSVIDAIGGCSCFDDIRANFTAHPEYGKAVLFDETQLVQMLDKFFEDAASDEESATPHSLMRKHGIDKMYNTYFKYCSDNTCPDPSWFIKFALRMKMTELEQVCKRLKIAENNAYYGYWTAACEALRGYAGHKDTAQMYKALDSFLDTCSLEDGKYYKALLPYETVDTDAQRLQACVLIGNLVLPYIDSRSRIPKWNRFEGMDMTDIFCKLSGCKDINSLMLSGSMSMPEDAINTYFLPEDGYSSAYRAIYCYRGFVYTLATGRVYNGQRISGLSLLRSNERLSKAAEKLDKLNESNSMFYIAYLGEFIKVAGDIE